MEDKEVLSFTFSLHGKESVHCNKQGIRVVREGTAGAVQAAPPNRYGSHITTPKRCSPSQELKKLKQ